MSLGPVMLDLEGVELGAEEREILQHPLVGAVILFSRNFESVEQLSALVNEIHSVRDPRLLVAVDHEGGRVQRFRRGFTRLPAVRQLGEIYNGDHRRAKRLADACGWVMASELRAVDIDFSFAPVIDLDRGISEVIGDRAFHTSPQVVADLAHSYMDGMKRAGMAATGKHFPGHGAVEADSHHAIPVDSRDYEDIYAEDIVPFERMIRYGMAAVMPAHVIYEKIDKRPAGFSPFWLKEVLRRRLEFQGIIFSDDLNMEGASVAGDYLARAEQAIDAGCDMILVCNNRAAALQVLDGMRQEINPVLNARLARMHGLHPVTWKELHANSEWRQAVSAIEEIGEDPSLELDL